MAKFKNLITNTGFFNFKDRNYDFNGIFETKEKDLIGFLSVNSNWEKVKEETKDELAELKLEAEKLGVKFQKNISLEKLKEKIEEFKLTNADADADADANKKDDLEDL